MKILFRYIWFILILHTQARAEVYSVLVGVSDYKNISGKDDLKYADDDVLMFYSFLTNDLHISESNILVLTNQMASYNNIIKAVNITFKKAKKEDTVIFYFSGHGDDGKLLPYDFDGVNNGLSFAKIAALFSSCASETKLIFADACRIGGLKPRRNETVNTITDRIIAMVSCKANENSIEYGSIQRGFFSYFLLEGLRGKADLNKDRKITITELHLYVKKNVSKVSRNTQDPITFGRFPLDQIILSY